MIKIQKIQKKDYIKIINLAKSLKKWFTKEGINQIDKDLEKQNGFVARLDNKIIGFLLYGESSYTPREDLIKITWMGVREDLHQKGIGKNLIQKLIYKLPTEIKIIQVATLSDTVEYEPYEKTRTFYRKMGFEEYRKKECFFPDGSKVLLLRLFI